MIYRCRNGLALQYLCDLCNSNDSMHSYNTRNVSQFRATKSHTAYYQCRFIVSGTSLSSFKSALFKFIDAKPQF